MSDRGLAFARTWPLVATLVLLLAGDPAGAQALGDALDPPATGPRVPVLLVPGWSDEAEQLEPLRRRFLSDGWDSGQVAALSFADPEGSNRDHARELSRALRALRLATGSERIDIVAHSMGGLATRYYLQHGGDKNVRRVVFLATPHRGTISSYLAWGEGADEMAPGSRFLLDLMSGRALPSGIEGITVRTPIDLHILPNESAALPPLPDVEVCCPTHAGLLDHDETYRVIRRFLLRLP